jgi:hypothetical protein
MQCTICLTRCASFAEPVEQPSFRVTDNTAREGIMIRQEPRIYESFLSAREECRSHNFAAQAGARFDG